MRASPMRTSALGRCTTTERSNAPAKKEKGREKRKEAKEKREPQKKENTTTT